MADDMVLVEHKDAEESTDDSAAAATTTTTTTTTTNQIVTTTSAEPDEPALVPEMTATTSEEDDPVSSSTTRATASAQKDTTETKSSKTKEKVQETVSSTTSEAPAAAIDDGPSPLQIVSIGTEDDKYAFTFHEEKLNEIMCKIPPGWNVAVVSVVGAFRTGKSFLLSWFLRYLHQLTNNKSKHDPTAAEQTPWYKSFESLGDQSGFHWRGGSERNTTGIWMWSHPHFVKRIGDDGKKETMAVLLVDSQGMFDNETTMPLTASIFGLSTLLSSYQIYNVEKRIQEDNLQQLALFSEYARLATDGDQETESSSSAENKPFQQIEFLVRDWQHFEDEEDFDKMEIEMKEYLEKVIADRDAKDLQETREQINACFENVSCYGFCHPGMKVIKKKFTGSVQDIEPDFLELLDRYCKRVFHADHLKPKTIQGRTVTAAELGAYIRAYAEMFSSGASFPEAATMLDATAMANNSNAVNLAVNQYKDTMNRIAGPQCSNYINPKELQEDHRLLMDKCMKVFDSMARFGSKRSIESSREKAWNQMEKDFSMYESMNEGRNPLAGLEVYIVPMVVALISFALRWIADSTCSPYSTVCKRSSDVLSHIYAVVVIFLIIVAATKAKQLKDMFKKVKAAVNIMMDDNGLQKAKRD